MHKTLKGEAIRPPRANLPTQQRAFTAFRRLYNAERPHEALRGRTPASLYRPSPRACKQHPIGLEELDNGIWSLYFCRVLLGRIDARDSIIRA